MYVSGAKFEEHCFSNFYRYSQICPEMQVNEMHALYDEHHKVSSFLKIS